jgi:hypothetical protein
VSLSFEIFMKYRDSSKAAAATAATRKSKEE